jgi:hypothetical protein
MLVPVSLHADLPRPVIFSEFDKLSLEGQATWRQNKMN